MIKKRIMRLLLFTAISIIVFGLSSMPVYARRYNSHKWSSNGDYLEIIFFFAFIIASIIVTLTSKDIIRKKKARNGPKDYTKQILDEITSRDPDFGEAKMINLSIKCFDEIITAICSRDTSGLSAFETEELIRRQEESIKALEAQGMMRIISRSSLQNTFFHFYRRDAHYEYLTVCIYAVMKERLFPLNDVNNQNEKSSLTAQYYLLTFMRNKNAKTTKASGRREITCPNCGAPVKVSNAAICGFCHSLIRSEEFDWVLCDVELLSEKDAPDNRGMIIEDDREVKFTKDKSPFFTGYYDNGIEDDFSNPFNDSF